MPRPGIIRTWISRSHGALEWVEIRRGSSSIGISSAVGGTEPTVSEGTEVSMGKSLSGGWSVGEYELVGLASPIGWGVSASIGGVADASDGVPFALDFLFVAEAKMQAFIAAGTGPVRIRGVFFRTSDNLRVVRTGPLTRGVEDKGSGVGITDVVEGGGDSAAA